MGVLNDEIKNRIRAYFSRYPTRQAVVLPALHVVNETLRHVPLEAVAEIAELLELAPADVYDTMSFYGFFKDEPMGRVRCWVCRSISCALRGSEDVLEALSKRLKVKPGQTTPDGAVTLEFAECLGACDFAPAVLAGETLHRNVAPDEVERIIDQLH